MAISMPRGAKQLLKNHKQVLSMLLSASKEGEQSVENVQRAADAMAEEALENLLKTIPAEKIKQEKRGLRLSALTGSGYASIYDLCKATTGQLAAVNGISDTGAWEIKSIAGEISAKAAKDLKIRLSADEKTEASTALIRALSCCRDLKGLSADCGRLYEENHLIIDHYGKALQPASGALKWLFTGKEKKQAAVDAQAYLQNAMDQVYGPEAHRLLMAINEVHAREDSAIWADFSADPIPYFNLLEEIRPGLLGNGDTLYGLPDDLAQEIQEEPFDPTGLTCTLRRYQEWGVKYILHQKNVLLGDEMGLGKTVQAIAAMVSLRNGGATHFLVICPASVIENWCREIRKHSDLTALKIHGDHREETLENWLKGGGVAVTNYETTRIFHLPDTFRFGLAVVDEAHYIKNPQANRTKNVREICKRTDRILLMTGTALENRVEEMVTLLSMLRPEVAREASQMASLSSAPQFQDVVAPVYYRRKRDDVLTELPELIETQEWCILGPGERSAYEHSVLNGSYAQARRVSWTAPDPGQSSKARRMLEIIEDAREDGRKVIVFSFFLDTIAKVQSLLPGKCLQSINGSVPLERRQEIIDEFNKAPAGTVLTAQIQAGGTGLNIQCASVIILCEPQFKPSIENQAISRAYRMGQTRNVLVYRLLAEDTVDEEIMKLLAVKQRDFDAFADESVAAEESRELDQKTFSRIMAEEAARIEAKNSGIPHSPESTPETVPETAPEYVPRESPCENTSETPVSETPFGISEQF